MLRIPGDERVQTCRVLLDGQCDLGILQQLVLATIPAIGDAIGQVLGTIEFDNQA